ncbi:NADH-ubiquinone oxidoreductase-F iron-sulfur binding region domain-containing protein [Leifsonia sp. McL0607]|uniref:NADH-ubiquinone oxidoreductase-F iron-sulfur binding region domain-containing protein n=1 Tax=Leifsonia sp. McL0607 TaxID=3415672 RepID=UPI003CE9D53C
MTMTVEPAASRATSRRADARRLFAAGSHAGLEAHLRAYRELPTRNPEAMLAELEAAGLTGRGGAAFPVWRKLAAARETAGGRRGRAPILIANGTEGEPLSSKDTVLLRNAPHLVIDGLLAAARSIAARNVLIIAEGDALQAVEGAIGERTDARNVEVVEGADGFVSGEASALVNLIENDDARPVDRTRRLTTSGLRGRPTVVQNVETLAHVALIARHGAAWFRSVGDPVDPGTRLVTVTGDMPSEGVYEVRTDATVRQVLGALRPDFGAIRAALIGGYHGAWVPESAFDLPLTALDLAPFDAAPGAGIIHVLGDHRCGLWATARIVEYLAGQSARQCGPCMFGLPTMADRFDAVASGEAVAENAADLARVAGLAGADRATTPTEPPGSSGAPSACSSATCARMRSGAACGRCADP